MRFCLLLMQHDALGLLCEGTGLLGIGLIEHLLLHQLFLEDLLAFGLLLDILGLLSVLVNLDDPDDSHQLDDPDRPGGRPRCLGLCGELRDGGGVAGGEDDVAEEVDIEDYGEGGDDIEEEEEGEEVAVYQEAAQQDLEDEDGHYGQADRVEDRVRAGGEEGGAEVVEEERVNGEHGDEHLVLEAEWIGNYLRSTFLMLLWMVVQMGVSSFCWSLCRKVSPLLLLLSGSAAARVGEGCAALGLDFAPSSICIFYCYLKI